MCFQLAALCSLCPLRVRININPNTLFCNWMKAGLRISLAILLSIIVSAAFAQKKYTLSIQQVDTSHALSFASIKKDVVSNTTFKDSTAAKKELQKIISELQSNGYLSASFDSVRFDSTSCKAYLYLGEKGCQLEKRSAVAGSSQLIAISHRQCFLLPRWEANVFHAVHW